MIPTTAPQTSRELPPPPYFNHVIDSGGTLCYAGAFDDGAERVARSGQYVARAVEQTVGGAPCVITSTQAFGQSIAWVK